jgi:hypothetical protein
VYTLTNYGENMANTTKIHDIVYKDAVRTLRNNTKFINMIEPRYDSTYSAHGAKEGEAIRLMQPAEFTVRSGNNIQIQDVEDKTVTLTRSVLRGVDFKYSSSEMTQDVDEFNKTKIAPAMATLAAKIDNYCMESITDQVYQAVALPVTSLDRVDILNSGVKLDNGQTPRDENRCVIINPKGHADVVNDSSGLFNNTRNVSQQYNDGIVEVPSFGYKFAMSQNVSSHTVGTHSTGSTPLTNGAGTEGASTLVTDGWANSTAVLKKGDIFTIGSVNQVDALHKTSLGILQQFVCTADGTSDGSGDLTISISPALISTGQYQNIDALPADGAAITVLGTETTAYPQNLAFHRGACAIGFIDLDKPAGATIVRKAEDGVSMRMWMDRDINTNSEIFRFDVLFGVQLVIPRWACRIYGL